jgi:enolase
LTSRIRFVTAREILDSRGDPTVEAEVALDDGSVGIASVPSGASTGSYEARELRDGDSARYDGRGVLKAVENVMRVLGPSLTNQDALDQQAIDDRLCSVDGSPDKSRLGANAVLAVSLANARAAARSRRLPLWESLKSMSGNVDGPNLLPMPMVNIVSGGRHSPGGLAIQDILIVPIGARTFGSALEISRSIRRRTASRLQERGFSTLKADEGGFGASIGTTNQVMDTLIEAIDAAGYRPGQDVALAIDLAATQLGDGDRGYQVERGGQHLTAGEVIAELDTWRERYPIVSLEDPLGEEDWTAWESMTGRLGRRCQIVCDDLVATNPTRLRRAIGLHVGNAVLIKLNQAGTLTEALEVVRVAHGAGYQCVVSARSGETEDSFISDLAVGCRAGQIKVGSLAQSDRLSKYNRLLAIEQDLGAGARLAQPFRTFGRAN